MKKFLLIPLFIVCYLINQQSYSQEVNIIPQPKEISFKTGHFSINKDTRIFIDPIFAKELDFVSKNLSDEIFLLTGIRVNIFIWDLKNFKNAIILASYDIKNNHPKELRSELKKNPESYSIDIKDRSIILSANNPKALFYATMSLIQIITLKNKRIPNMLIQDWPSYKVRGISDDISRGQVSKVENFKKIIRFLARYKMNTYMLYLEDMFSFKKYPSIGKNRGALTLQEVNEIQNYAKKYFIEIIPIFQTLGHYENILLQQEFIHLAEYPGAASLNTSDEKTYSFLNDLLGEIAPVFESQYFHMGADESYDVGLGFSKERVKKLGLDEVHVLHYKRVHEILTKLNKKVLMYGDIILENPQILEKLPKDIIIVDWHYNAATKYSSIAKFKKSGFKFYISPGIWNWRKVYPAYNEASINIYHLNKQGFLGGAEGSITSLWGDDGSETFRELNWYGYALAAACAWAPIKTNINDFLEKFLQNHFGISDNGLCQIFQSFADVGIFSDYHDIWRQPFIPLRPTPEGVSENVYAKRVFLIQNKMKEVLKQLPEILKISKRNNDDFKYLRFCAKQLLWFANKLIFSEEINQICENREINPDNKNLIISYCDKMVDDLRDMKQEYSNLWLLTNKPDNLNLIMKRYDHQISYWQEKKSEIISDIYRTDYLIKSKWICDENGNPGQKDKGQVYKSIFKKEFDITSPLKKAYLQIIADDFAQVNINGIKIGEVYARRTLSLTVEFERVKYWDVTKFLKTGKNTIEIQVQNFDENGSAGVNAYLELLNSGDSQKIISDSTWICFKYSDSEKQSNLNFWRPVKNYSKYTITEPNFKVERCSWIEK